MASVVKIVELMGVSETSFDDAVKEAVKEAANTIRNITGVEVIKMTADVDGSEVFEYHVTVRLAFVIDRDGGAADEEDSEEEEATEDEPSDDADDQDAEEEEAEEEKPKKRR